MSPDLNHQLGTMSKEKMNLALLLYTVALQKEAETGPKIGNVKNPRTNKRSCVFTV